MVNHTSIVQQQAISRYSNHSKNWNPVLNGERLPLENLRHVLIKRL